MVVIVPWRKLLFEALEVIVGNVLGMFSSRQCFFSSLGINRTIEIAKNIQVEFEGRILFS